MTGADPLMRDWTGPIDERYFEEQRRRQAGTAAPPRNGHAQPAEPPWIDEPVPDAPARPRPAPRLVPDPEPRKAMTAGEFLAAEFPAGRWRTDQLLPAEGLALVLGAEKAGKSLLGLQLAACVAAGQPFLGRAMIQAPALLVEEEGSGPSMQDRLRRQVTRLGLNPADLAQLHIAVRQRYRLDDPAAVNELEAEIVRTGAKVIVIGPLAQVQAGVDENKAGEVNGLARTLVDISARHHVLVVLVHHRRKDDRKAGPPKTVREFFDSSRGSSALVGAVDAGLGLSRDPEEASGTVYVLLRDAPADRISIELDEPSLTFWPGDPVGRFTDGPASLAAVERFVVERAEYVPVALVSQRLGLGKEPIRDRLTALVADHRLSTRPGPRGSILYGPPTGQFEADL